MQIGQIGRVGRVGLAPVTGVPWWAAAKYSAIDTSDSVSKRAAAIADFRRWRFAITTVAAESISGASVAALGVLREATFAEWFAFTSGGGTYVDSSGVMQTAASNSPRRDYSTGVGRLGLNNAATNKVTCRKHNPVDTSNLTKTGDAAATLSVVDDTAALAAAGLAAICTNGTVYKLDNSLGTTTATVAAAGNVGNTNQHTMAAYIRGGSGWLRDNSSGTTLAFTSSASYRVVKYGYAPAAAGGVWQIQADAAQVVYFILPQLVEQAFLSPIIPGNTLSAVTRPIEAAQFGAVPTALMQRATATVVVRGKLVGSKASPAFTVLLGYGSSPTSNNPMYTDGSAGALRSYPGSDLIGVTGLGVGWEKSAFGAALAMNPSGRSITANGSAVVTSSVLVPSPASAFLGKDYVSSFASDGYYDEVVIFPFRVANADLPRLAVPYA